ncbi:lysozyme inhibitor LprI family protein [Phenylobacterium sp.]|uniref:lysozyme inhibitor LprI family protein n=1 Tax=Phenylobacterium sp. TaxID=1871053 RepID=UPI001220C4AB|nr:lysozyme inhibitor LprI family protein [Phenylobacterium sp.]THD59787.1 MAG: DUF1311 domain-containing protein [Phenylobacterium sp.]
MNVDTTYADKSDHPAHLPQMRSPLALTILVGLAIAAPAAAQTQIELNQLAAANFRKADAQLNALYRRVTNHLPAGAKAKLVASQRLWISFRDAECRFRAESVAGGSAQPMVFAGCQATLTRERIKSLSAVTVGCQEGDVSCLRTP